MVDILNIEWDNEYAKATLVFDGDKNRTCRVVIDCEKKEVIENSLGEMNSYIAHARNRLCKVYAEGKRPRVEQSVWC